MQMIWMTFHHFSYQKPPFFLGHHDHHIMALDQFPCSGVRRAKPEDRNLGTRPINVGRIMYFAIFH